MTNNVFILGIDSSDKRCIPIQPLYTEIFIMQSLFATDILMYILNLYWANDIQMN